MDLLALAISKLKIELSQVVDHKINDNDIAILVNYGIAGVKKFTFTVKDLQAEVAQLTAEAEAQKVDRLQTKLRGKKR